jgi:hypothetical protein
VTKKPSGTAEAAEPERVAAPSAATPPAREPELKEQHYTIYYGDTGHSYESLIAPVVAHFGVAPIEQTLATHRC